MSQPNITNALQNQASAKFDGSAGVGAVLQPGSANISGVVRNGVGDYTFTMGVGCGINDRAYDVSVATVGATGAGATIGAETTTTFQVLVATAAGVAADLDIQIDVERFSTGI